MGSWFSCCRENNDSQSGDVNERTHLLVDPVGAISTLQRDQSDDLLVHYPNSLPKKADEQTALNKILVEAATNVIDVAALGSHIMEQHEYMERMNKYNSRITVFSGGPRQSPVKHKCFLLDIPTPDKVLASPPIIVGDLVLIKSATRKVRSALEEVKVNHGEDLVVPFCIP